jgi:hypothetical protein
VPKFRETTNKILAAIEEGTLSWQQVAEGALAYMSEDDVASMAHNEEFFLYELYELYDDEDDEDEEDPEPMSLGELTEIARLTVEVHIEQIRKTDPDDIGRPVWQLAYDSVIENGGEESQARIIAGYMRTQF